MKCAAHPNVETNLRCGKCGKPICPKCLVQTPVGARCPECAKVQRPVTYQVPPQFYLRAVGVGFGIGVASGIAWSLIRLLIPFSGFFVFFVAAGIGLLVGEVIGLSVNRKRGLGLQIIAGVSVVVSYVVQSWASGWFYSIVPVWNLADLISLYGIIALVVGVGVAVSRLH